MSDRAAMYEIQSDVPLRARKTGTKHRWDKLDINDSMLVPDWNAYKAARQWGKRYGRKIVARVEGDAVRIWRVE